MSNEIEVKVLDIDIADIKSRLQAAGCQSLGQEFQQNFMFDYANRRLYEEQDGSYIRLRRSQYFPESAQNPETTVLTYKKTLSRERFKIAQETETAVSDFEQTRQFLALLDLRQVRSDEKYRQSYRFEDILFEIDEWAGLPAYLEVEASSEERVSFGLSLLGLSLADSTSMNLREVLTKYKIKASNLHFADFGRNILAEISAN